VGKNLEGNWKRVLQLFGGLSEKMSETRRVIFFIDPEKYVREGAAQEWLAVCDRLPQKFMFVIAQRPDDSLASDPQFAGTCIERIPEDHLEPLIETAADGREQMVGLRFA